MKILIALLLSLSIYPQASISPLSVDMDAASVSTIVQWMSSQAAMPPVKITADISANDVKIPVSKTTGITGSMAISINGEHMDIKSVSASELTVTRGFNGTSRASHSASSDVVILKYRTINDLARTMILHGLRQIVENYEVVGASASAAVSAKSKAMNGIK